MNSKDESNRKRHRLKRERRQSHSLLSNDSYDVEDVMAAVASDPIVDASIDSNPAINLEADLELLGIANELSSASLRMALDGFIERSSEPSALICIANQALNVLTSKVTEKIDTQLDTTDELKLLQRLLSLIESQGFHSRSQYRSATILALRSAVHHGIAVLSLRSQFRQSVEEQARRQMYNMAYGLTHEINNPLANIVARAQQLISAATTDADRKSLATVVDQAMRAHEMLAEVMRAVRPPAMALQCGDVVGVCKDSAELMKGEIERAMVKFELQLPEHAVFANIHHDSLRHAIRSALQNSLEASRPNDSIQLCCEEVADLESELGWIRISIRDTGKGLTAASLAQAWDLFYSGREHGRGLGISLAVIRRVIESHHGQLKMRSEQGAGCTIEIMLPRAQAPQSERRRIRI